MENYPFRTAPIGGFNRDDVAAYIKKTRDEADARAARLEEQVRLLQESSEASRRALEDTGAERDELARRLEEAELRCGHAQNNWDAQRQATEAIRADVSARDAAVQGLMAEKERLTRRVLELEEQISSFRRDKERVAQLELEARQRAADTVEEAQRQAAEIEAQAEARARDLEAQTKNHTGAMLRETEERLTAIVEQYGGLFSSFESISAHVSSELRKMDVSVSQLPLSFNHLREGLQAVLEKANSIQA